MTVAWTACWTVAEMAALWVHYSADQLVQMKAEGKVARTAAQ